MSVDTRYVLSFLLSSPTPNAAWNNAVWRHTYTYMSVVIRCVLIFLLEAPVLNAA